jgi:multisubunit Na+/H+ antiporter MnhG subunit
MSWFLSIIALILIIIFLISAGLLTQASIKIGPSSGNVDLEYAYKITTWIAVLTWLILALIIIGIIVYYVFYFESGGPEISAVSNVVDQYSDTLGTGLTIFLLIISILVLIVGIFATIAAIDISRSPGYTLNVDVYRAYEDCAVSAGLSLGAIGLIIGLIIYYNISSSYDNVKNENINSKK